MNNIKYSLLLKNTCFTVKQIIRNTDLPVCSNCSHFIQHENNYPYDAVPSDKLYGRCKKFGEINIITGSIEYDFAKNCRDDNKKCGKDAYIIKKYKDK